MPARLPYMERWTVRIAFLMTDGFDDREFRQPYDDLRAGRVDVVIVGPAAGAVLTGKLGHERVTVDLGVDHADPTEFDGVVIPGGHSPDRLRIIPAAVGFVAQVCRAGKLTAAICHGPWMLIEADVVRDRTLTGWASVRTDVINAGGNWVDTEVAVDANLITSRRPSDVPAFTRAILQMLSTVRPATDLARP